MASTLRELAQSRGTEYGCAVCLPALDVDPVYQEVVAKECGVLVAENASKFGPLCPSEGVHDFSGFDRIVAFAEAHRMKSRGHALLWHNQAPAWLVNGDHPAERVREILRDHIAVTVGRYRGKIESWDVVNEAVSDEGGMRETFWSNRLGPDYAAWAFHEAHRADPDAELVYNDYSIDDLNPKSDLVYDLVRGFLDSGVPIHAVGLQAHLELDNPPDPASVRENVRRFRQLGLKVLVTEMDVRMPEPFDDEKRAAQGAVYRDFVRACLDEGAGRILTWGITDNYSWIPGFFQGTGEALPLDASGLPKPAYHGLASAFGS